MRALSRLESRVVLAAPVAFAAAFLLLLLLDGRSRLACRSPDEVSARLRRHIDRFCSAAAAADDARAARAAPLLLSVLLSLLLPLAVRDLVEKVAPTTAAAPAVTRIAFIVAFLAAGLRPKHFASPPPPGRLQDAQTCSFEMRRPRRNFLFSVRCAAVPPLDGRVREAIVGGGWAILLGVCAWLIVSSVVGLLVMLACPRDDPPRLSGKDEKAGGCGGVRLEEAAATL